MYLLNLGVKGLSRVRKVPLGFPSGASPSYYPDITRNVSNVKVSETSSSQSVSA